MARVKFVKDLWWLNGSLFEDELGNVSSAVNNICKKLNQTAGSIVCPTSTASFYCRIEDTEDIPEKVRVVFNGSSSISGTITILINDITVYSKTFIGATTDTQTTTLSNADLLEVIKSRKNLNYDAVKITVAGSGSKTLTSIEIYYESDTSATYNNHEAITNANTKYAYPTYPSHTDVTHWTGASGIAWSTSSSANDSNAITQTREITDGSTSLDLRFNISGSYTRPTTIQRAFLNFRYNQSGTQNSAQSDFFSVYATSPKLNNSEAPFMWGKGFPIEPSSSGFRVGTVPMYFINQEKSSKYFNTSSLFDYFDVKFIGLPSGLKISAMEMLLYDEPDNLLPMHTLSEVSHIEDTKYPIDDNSGSSTTGRNRFKAINSDSFFDIGFWALYPSGTVSNTNISGTLSKTPEYWDNYYNSQIQSYSAHNDCYNNAILMSGNQMTLSGMNLNGNFSVYMQISSSGDSLAFFNDGNLLTKYNAFNQPELKIDCYNHNFRITAYDDFGSSDVIEIPASSNNQLVLTNSNVSGTHTIRAYHGEGNEELSLHDTMLIQRTRSSGNIILFSGLVGYLHEFGFASRAINAVEFSNTRHKYQDYLRGSGIQINIPSTSGVLEDMYYLAFNRPDVHNSSFYQMNSPYYYSYNTVAGNPSGFYFDIEYESTTNNPSGIGLSGIYYNGYNESSNNFAVGFTTQLASGVGTKRLYSNIFENRWIHNPDLTNYYEYTRFHVNNQRVDGYYSGNLKIKSFSVTYDGWQTLPTGFNYVNFVTLGEQRTYSNLDFYLHSNMNTSGVDFFTSAKQGISGYLDFYTGSSLLSSGIFTGYVYGAQVSREPINFFTEGTTPVSVTSGVNFYQYSTTNPSLFKSVDLFTESELDDRNAINMYIGSAQDETEDSINFYVQSDSVYNKSVEMYVANNRSGVDYSLNFYAQANYSGLTSDINMSVN